jgi:hypothetical protein
MNFLPEILLFDPRRVWSALMRAEARGAVISGTREKIEGDLGQTAIWLALRDYVLRTAVAVLKNSLACLSDRLPEPWSIPEIGPGGIRYKVVSGEDIFQDREKVLLAVDSLLFEFRAYLDLLARFVFGVLKGIGHAPRPQERLSSGEVVTIETRKGKLKPHDFLLYLCDRLSLHTEWYQFLVQHRNFFTHEGAPYIAIEDRIVRPPKFDFIIMRINICDFSKASPEDYFRLSEFANVWDMVVTLSVKAQEHLVGLLEH